MKRLIREFRYQKNWVIAIVLLIAFSSGIYSSFRSTYDSGIQSLDNADEKLNTSDITISTIPISDPSLDIKNIPGISMVSSAFITDTYTFVDDTRVRGEIIGVEIGERVDNYEILKGRDLKAGNEVVIEHHYADKHNVKIGEKITLYLSGKTLNLTVCGICFSPNHIYLISPDGWIEKDFGIFFVSREILNDSINTLYIKLLNKNKENTVLSSIRMLFVKRGINPVVKPSSKTFAYTAFREDLGAMNSLANLFSGILLAISAFIIFVVLSRIIDRKRHEIGTLRAMGFSKWSIFSHYIYFSCIIAIIGAVISIPLGFWLLASIMNYWGVNVLSIPEDFIAYKLDLTYVIHALIFAIIFSIIGAFFPSYRASSFTPAEAMKPYMATRIGTRILSRKTFPPLKKLVLRDIMGHKARSISTIMVTALVLSLGLSFALSMDSYVEGIKYRFDENELWDIKISFDTLQDNSTIDMLNNLQGIEKVEPYVGYGAEISYRNKSIIIQLNELIKDSEMHDFSLAEGKINYSDMLISGDAAHRLGLSIGDRVTLFTPYGIYEKKYQEYSMSLVPLRGIYSKTLILLQEHYLKLRR